MMRFFFTLLIACLSANSIFAQIDNTKSLNEIDSVVVPASCIVDVPNAFSPNGDGQNDELQVKGKDITKINFTIYNRWGQKMFYSETLTRGWDGILNGSELNSEVFTYFLRATCIDQTTIEKKGTITLLR